MPAISMATTLTLRTVIKNPLRTSIRVLVCFNSITGPPFPFLPFTPITIIHIEHQQFNKFTLLILPQSWNSPAFYHLLLLSLLFSTAQDMASLNVGCARMAYMSCVDVSPLAIAVASSPIISVARGHITRAAHHCLPQTAL